MAYGAMVDPSLSLPSLFDCLAYFLCNEIAGGSTYGSIQRLKRG